jgi:hypothetical protein
MLRFVFTEHQKLALYAAFLFVVGLFLSWPVVHYRLRLFARLPLTVFRLVLRAVGPAPGVARLAGCIFVFNVTVIFADMALGFHPLVPKLLCIWTGMNVGILACMGDAAGLAFPRGSAEGQWRPPPALAAASAFLVLLLELPCFWLAIAMGVSLGHAVARGSDYLPALALRTQAYCTVIAPLLACSALAEAIAIRGASSPSATEESP